MRIERKVISPYQIRQVLFRKEYPGYIYQRELINAAGITENSEMEMVNCYAIENKHWIGGAKEANFLCKKVGLRKIECPDGGAYKGHPAIIGFNEKEKKWYGWSHRAICGFGIGDKIFEENFGDDKTNFKSHGEADITTMAQAQQAAINFAHSVS